MKNVGSFLPSLPFDLKHILTGQLHTYRAADNFSHEIGKFSSVDYYTGEKSFWKDFQILSSVEC